MEPFRYHIERLEENRLPDVRKLLAEVLNKKVSLDYLHTKYGTQHTGHQYLSSIAYEGTRPIAFYGTIPQIFTDPQSAQFIGTHLSDCMTVESHQRRGLHQQLGHEVYDWLRAEGVNVIYGFHSEQTQRSSKKLGWKEWGRLRGYWIQTGRVQTGKVYRKLPILDNWQRNRIQRTMAQYAIAPTQFSNSNAPLGLTVEYSPAFFATKEFHQNYRVELKGVKFWLGIDAEVRIGDVHFENPQQFLDGLEELKRICRKLGIGDILFQSYPGSRLDEALATQYTGFESWMVGYLELLPGVDFMNYRPNYGDQDSF